MPVMVYKIINANVIIELKVYCEPHTLHLFIGNVISNLEILYFHLNFECNMLTPALTEVPHTLCTSQVPVFNSDQTEDGRWTVH